MITNIATLEGLKENYLLFKNRLSKRIDAKMSERVKMKTQLIRTIKNISLDIKDF